MISISSGARVWLVTGHTDMRKGFRRSGADRPRDIEARPAFRPSLRFSRPPRVSDQVSLERRPGLIPRTRRLEPVGPFAHSDGHDPPRLIDELVPSVAAVIDDVVEGFEDPVREPIFAHELPDVFLGI